MQKFYAHHLERNIFLKLELSRALVANNQMRSTIFHYDYILRQYMIIEIVLFNDFRYFPSNLEVIDWLGSYFIEMQVSEKAIGYFERAALMQPDDVRYKNNQLPKCLQFFEKFVYTLFVFL